MRISKAPRWERSGVRPGRASLKQDFAAAKIALPEHFVLEISYKEHVDAVRRSFYPGFRLTDDRTIVMETDDYTDVLRSIQFVL